MSRTLFARLAYRFDPEVRARVDAYSRRDMLRLLAAGAAGLTLSGALGLRSARGGWVLPRVRADAPHVIVVGAGLAGLACAYELRSAGCTVTVIEARGRLGGRVVSFSDFVPGGTVEGGGEFIGINHPYWVSYAERFKLDLSPVSESGEDLHSPVILGGRTLTFDEVEHLYGEMSVALETLNEPASAVDARAPWTSPDAEKLDAQSLEEWLSELNVAEQTTSAIRAQVQADNGVALNQSSLLGMLACIKGHGLQRYWTDTETHRCKDGNQRLALALADAIGRERITLGRAVRRIEVTETGVAVELGDGAKVSGDELVLATPPSVWNKIQIEPALPAAMTPQMGVALKHLLLVSERFWRKAKLAPESMSDGDFAMTWEGTDGQACEQASLNAFAGGAGAQRRSAAATNVREAECVKQLEAAYPGLSAQVKGSRFMNWPQDPSTMAGYSFPAPGQVTTVGPLMAAPHGPGADARLHIAGEHACYGFVGYMEGALTSGSSVAERIAVRAGLGVGAGVGG